MKPILTPNRNSLSVSGVDLGECVREGYAVWARNRVLGAPYALSIASVLSFLAVMAVSTALSFVFFGRLAGAFAGVLAAFASIAAVTVIPAFFAAAAIRMAWKALKGDAVGFMDSFRPEGRAVLGIILFYALTWLVAGALLVPMLAAEMFLRVNVFILFGLAFGCGLMFVQYNIVLTGRGFVKSLWVGFDAFRRNWLAAGLLYGLASYVGQLVGFAAVPAAFLVLSGFTPFSGYASGARPEMLILFSLAVGFAVFMAATVFFSAVVVAPLTTLWQLDLYRRVGGLRDDN